ncbi:MAG: VWA domain-containing protein [Spirochaetaceae bacterium]|nr:VWA domain-containing protein [Spirochaetaceae bacterium]
MYRRFFHLFFLLCPVLLAAQAGPAPNNPALAIGPEDLRIEQQADGGFHLYIKKKPGIGSVLLTESTRDPALKSDNYAYRAPEWNPVNGDEIRLLDGKPIPKASQIWSLIDSTPELHPELGEAFHIFVPYILNYGYENSRHGEVYVTAGTFLNIRAFSLPYADYRGSFRDNPFTVEVAAQQPQPGPADKNYMKETKAAFAEISDWEGGTPYYSVGPDDIVDRIKDIINKEKAKTMDIVICLDTTGSMKNDIAAIRKDLVPALGQTLAGSTYRIGMLLFKDYTHSEYLTRVVPYTADLNQVQRSLNGITVNGGGDIPEAVYEGLYDAAVKFNWEADARLIILIGDAPPHLRQRGKISKEMVKTAAAERGIRIHTIILPQ